ncbi:MAG: GDP-mannose pyrophosphatase NudK [Leeuwenhoekiella sp.]
MQKKKVRNIKSEILSNNWYTLRKVTFEYLRNDGEWELQQREAYDRGNGATILLYNIKNKTVILTRQFRMPSFLNGNPSGMLIETCAGLLDQDNAEDCIKRETEEETGYMISHVKKVFEAYMSPGSVTEIIHFFIAEYTPSMKVSRGGGATDEQEEIEVLELEIDRAVAMIENGEIKDGKTIMQLQYIQLKKIFTPKFST